MPVVKVFVDRSLDTRLEEGAEDLIEEIADVVVPGLDASRAKCQILFVPGALISPPYTVYVDLQYRAKESRSIACVTAVLKDLEGILARAFAAPVRLRGFAIDQSTLSAVDSPLEGQAS